MLIFLAGLTFGATRALHAGLIGWVAILAVLCFAVTTINVTVFLGNPHLQCCNALVFIKKMKKVNLRRRRAIYTAYRERLLKEAILTSALLSPT